MFDCSSRLCGYVQPNPFVATDSLEARRSADLRHAYSKLRSTASAMAIAVGLLTAAGASSAEAQTFDRFIVIQPIQVCDNAGNNCAPVDFRQAATAQALKQAGVLPIFLSASQFNDSTLLANNAGPDSFDDGDGGSSDGGVINMWFTAAASITSCGGATPTPPSIFVGCAGGREAVIDGSFSANRATNNGLEHNLIPHELGHDLGLPHNNGAANLMDPTIQTGQFSAIGVTTFLISNDERNTVRANGNVHLTPADLNGDASANVLTLGAGQAALNIFGQGDNDLIVLGAGSGVLQNVQGDAGNDTIFVLNGSIVGNDVDGGADNDQIQIGGLVMHDVLGGSGNDDIAVLNTAEIIHNINGGEGNDTISVDGKVAAGQFQPFSAFTVATVASPTQINGGGGEDSITLENEALVAGSVFGGADNDTIVMRTGASMAGDINGEGGIDTITILGGTVARFSDGAGGPISGGNVLGGGDGDFITIAGGTIAGNVDGEGGNDNILISGGTVRGNVLGGADNEIMNLTGGSVSGNVEGGSGADIITLDGALVANDLSGGGDNDQIFVRSGSVRNVLGGGGDDAALWTGGTITRSVDMGGGTDTLEIRGVNFGGSAQQAGLLFLDGGDNASSADGSVDTLNLRGVVEVLTDLRNWEFINLVDNSQGDLGQVSRTIETEQFQISSNSRLIATSSLAATQVYTIDGNLFNRGVVDMLDNAPSYDELAVTGTYTGDPGSLFRIDTFLGAAGSPSDLMRVGTATAGQSGIVVNDTNSGPGVFNPNGIEVVRVESALGGNTDADDFTLIGGPIQKDLWIFDLALDDTRANPGRANADVHVLYSRPSDVVQFTPYFATGALTAFHSSLEPWIDRQQALADTLASNGGGTGSLKDAPMARSGTFVDLWVSPYGSRRSEENTSKVTFFGDTFSTRTDYDQSTYGIQAGVDLISIQDDRSALMGGVFGGLLQSSVTPDAIAVSGEYEGGSVGAYAAYVQGGFSLSGVVKADFLDFDWKAPALGLDASSEVETYGGRLEAAYKHLLGYSGSWLQPYANVTFANSSWDQFSVLATTFAIDDNESLLGRAGLRLGSDLKYDEGQHVKVYVGAGVVYEFDEENTATIQSGGFDLPLVHEVDQTSLEVQGGFKFEDMPSGLSVSINSSGRFSGDTEEYGGRATFNLQF